MPMRITDISQMGGLPLTGILGAVLAAGAAVVLMRVAQRRRGAPRHARRLLSAGMGSAAVLPLLVPAAERAVAHGWLADPPPRTGLATAVAVATAVTTVLLVTGLVGLAGVDSYRAAMLRHGLDGALIGAALCFVGWALVSQGLPVWPGRAAGDGDPSLARIATVVSAAVLAVGLGMVAAGVCRTRPPRVGPVVAGLGVLLTVAGGVATALALCWRLPALAPVGGAAVAAGALMLAAAAPAPDPPGPDPDAALRGGTSLVLPPVAAVVIVGMYHGLTAGWTDPFGVTAATVVAGTLVARHYLTVADARRYAERLSQREAHFRQLAHTDPLTGLANRRRLFEVMQERVVGGPPCVLLALDLDGFKDVNDMRGHDIGDAVLVEVGRRLAEHLRPGDLAARLGGDEFAVLMWTVPERARPVAERLLAALSEPYRVPGTTVYLSVSVGLAAGGTAADVATLLRNADLALRYAKQQGKARVEEYDAAYDAMQRRRSTLDQGLRGAIERGELHLLFQPVVALPSMRPAGAEALLRWHHPELGAVSPEEFVAVAEESGMVSVVGSWVLHQACHALSRLLAEGHDVWLSINVSPRELRSADYLKQVSDALIAHRVPPQRLVLEVTEHAVATDVEELATHLARLRAVGVRIALDGFGAGYSSLSQLRELPVDLLKIDRRLVDAGPVAAHGGRSVPLVDVVVRLGQRLGLEVIADGVSDEERLRAVVDAGCRFGQGRYLGAAVPAEYLEAQLGAADPGTGPRGAFATGRPGRRAAAGHDLTGQRDGRAGAQGLAAAQGSRGPTGDHGDELAAGAVAGDSPGYHNPGRLDAGAQMRHG